MYHRVTEAQADPFGICVSPENFESHLKILRQYCDLVSLSEMARAADAKEPLERKVAVTFDDGYVDNLLVARPLLEKYEVPATVFITTGYVRENREFWWDVLERTLLQPSRLPETLRLTIQGKVYQWELGTAATYTEMDFHRYRSWSWFADEGQEPGDRQRLYRSLYNLLAPLPKSDCESVMKELSALADCPNQDRLANRMLTPEEVRILDQSPFVEIGSHTETHPYLTTQPLEIQQQEIHRGKAQLESLLKRSVTSFAYPHGDHDSRTIELIREVGFQCACTTVSHKVWQKPWGQVDRFRLPRVQAQNYHQTAFTDWLLPWMRAAQT